MDLLESAMNMAGTTGLEEGHRRLTVFGLMGTLNSQAGVIIFVLLLVYLIMLEEGFERLEHWAHANDVIELIDKLKEELMMMGILSFTIFIYIEAAGSAISSGSKVYNYYLAFEMSHVILLFITIAFIFQGAYLLSYAIKQGKSYLKSKRLSAKELLEEINDLKTDSPFRHWMFHNIPWWFPANYPSLRKRCEVKIVERLFLEYQKREEDFRFAHYISKLFQAYIGELGKVSNRSWFVVAACIVLNYARIVALDGTWNHADICHDTIEGESGHRRLGGSSVACAIYLYGYALFISWMVPLFCFIVLIFAKYYKTRVLDIGLAMLGVSKSGISGSSSRQNYLDALLELEKVEELATNYVEKLQLEKKEHVHPEKHSEKSHGAGHGGHGETAVAVVIDEPVGDEALQAVKDTMRARLENEFDVEWKGRGAAKCSTLADIFFPKSFGYPSQRTLLSQLFLFDSPLWFFHHVELCLLFQSMYVSIWATQLIPLTVKYPGWAIALTIPMCCNFLIIQLLLHDAVILKAVCEIHGKAIAETVEEEEMEESCLETLKDKLNSLYLEEESKLERAGKTAPAKHVWLKKEFMVYDADGSGEISSSELNIFLVSGLGITLLPKELKVLWLALDEDLSGEIQWSEFYTAVFPADKHLIKDEIEVVKKCQSLLFVKMAQLGIDASEMSSYLRGLFDKFDADQSGSIECSEFTILIKDITGPENAPSDKEMRDMFSAIDFDKGGGINFPELAKLLTPPKDKLQKILTKSKSIKHDTHAISPAAPVVASAIAPAREPTADL